MTTAVTTIDKRRAAIGLTPTTMIVSLLVMLTLTGVVAGVARLFLGLGATTTLSDTYPWGIWIGFDFSLIAFSGAGFTLAALAHVLRREKYHAAVKPAVLAGLLGYTAVLLLLVLDLGRPDRFYHFIIFWNVHSPLFEISWCVLLYTTVLLIENSPLVLEWLNGWRTRRLRQQPTARPVSRPAPQAGDWHALHAGGSVKPEKPARLSRWLSAFRASRSELRSGLKADGPIWLLQWVNWEKLARFVLWIMTPVAILGVTLSSLHQSTLGTLYLNMPHRLHPLWFSPIMSLPFFISSITAGVSVAIIAYLIAARIHGEEADPEVVDGLGRIVAWVTLLYVVLKLVEIWLAGEMSLLLAFDRPSLLMWLELGVGAILPMIMLFIPSVRRHKVGRWLAPLLVIFGVFANRFNATLFAQMLPPGAPGYTPHILEWLSTVGILAGVALAWYLAVRLFVRFDEKGHHAA